ncbi:MAG TPA: hypothetical protein VER33_27325 [Polyangiaceae bacterium]|nr:hypothetical protein [Polyangiaceae bacterium]
MRIESLFLALTLTLTACNDFGPRVYTAQAYDPEAMCLMPYGPLALVEAQELRATCGVQCLRYRDALYLSTVCAPYPADAAVELPETSPECALALQSLQSEAFCDAETDVDAGVDSTEGPDAGGPQPQQPDPGGASDAGSP